MNDFWLNKIHEKYGKVRIEPITLSLNLNKKNQNKWIDRDLNADYFLEKLVLIHTFGSVPVGSVVTLNDQIDLEKYFNPVFSFTDNDVLYFKSEIELNIFAKNTFKIQGVSHHYASVTGYAKLYLILPYVND